MALLDGLLGGGNDSSTDSTNFDSQSNSTGLDLGTAPALGVNASDILQSFDSSSDGGQDGDTDTSAFSGIGDLGLGLVAPTTLGFDNASQSASASNNQSDSDGGLLQGLI